MKKLITVSVVVVLFGVSCTQAGTWTTLDYGGFI